MIAFGKFSWQFYNLYCARKATVAHAEASVIIGLMSRRIKSFPISIIALPLFSLLSLVFTQEPAGAGVYKIDRGLNWSLDSGRRKKATMLKKKRVFFYGGCQKRDCAIERREGQQSKCFEEG